ncbi:MAG: hypothetical protein AAB214_20240 [Fibrobacterota bacterium]
MKKIRFAHLGCLLAMGAFSGCLSGTTDPADSAVDTTTKVAPSKLTVAALYSDYTSYGVARLVDGVVVDSFAIQGAKGSGAVLGASGRTLFVINQATSAITAYRDGINDKAHVVFDVNVGKGTNPYQALQVGSKVYVVRWETNNLLVLSAATGDSIGSIDLSANANAEGAVKPSKALFAGGKLWVLAQRTRADYSYDSAIVVAVDTSSKVAARGVVLPGSVNSQDLAEVAGKLYVVSHGTWDTTQSNAGIDRIDLATGKWEATIGGLMSKNKPTGCASVAGKLWVAVARDNWASKVELVNFDLSTGALGAPVAGLQGVGPLAVSGSRLWAGNKASGDKQAVVEIDPLTGIVLQSTKTPLPPTDLAILP